MKQIKIFQGTDLVQMEQEINEWLSTSTAKHDTTTKISVQTYQTKEALGTGTFVEYIIVILYQVSYGK